MLPAQGADTGTASGWRVLAMSEKRRGRDARRRVLYVPGGPWSDDSRPREPRDRVASFSLEPRYSRNCVWIG